MLFFKNFVFMLKALVEQLYLLIMFLCFFVALVANA